VNEDLQTEKVRDLYGLIGALVVDQDFDVCHFGKLADSLLERLRRIVGGHDDRDALPVNHSALLSTLDDKSYPAKSYYYTVQI
jgi:hypothetical protein